MCFVDLQKAFNTVNRRRLMEKLRNIDVHKPFIMSYLGSQSSKAFLVSSGCDVGFLTQPNLFEMRWTCVSTPMPTMLFQALFMARYAILGPTPDNLHSSSTVCGMSPSYWSRHIIVVFLMYSTFL